MRCQVKVKGRGCPCHSSRPSPRVDPHHTYTHKHTHTCTHVYVYTHMYLYTYMYTHARTHTCLGQGSPSWSTKGWAGTSTERVSAL